MFSSVPVSHSIDFEGQKLELQTGLLATQATQTVLAKIGETVVLAAIVVGKEKGGDYFPLQVVYEERLYAAGKIKGSRFVKREGKPTDNAVLTGRMVDRSLRSLFSPYLRTEVQVVITVLSLDEVNPPDTLAVIAASSALTLCGFERLETVPEFDFSTIEQKNWPKSSQSRVRSVALIQVKGTEKFVAFTKNKPEFYQDGYFLPGGGLDSGESSVETAARETLEELGLAGLEHLASLGKCQVVLPYEGNLSQNLEFYEWFEVESQSLENLVKSEKDEQNWEIVLVDIDTLRSNNWPQLNLMLDKLQDQILRQALANIQQVALENSSENLDSRAEVADNSSLEHFINKLQEQKIFTGPVSSVRLGLKIEPLGAVWLQQIETELAKNPGNLNNDLHSKPNFEKADVDATSANNQIDSGLENLMIKIAQTLDKNNPNDLDFIKQIGQKLGKVNPNLAIKFKEIYKKSQRLAKSEIWAQYPTKYEFIINPSYEVQADSQLDLVVSGNGQNIVMVECGANIIPESIIAEGFDVACKQLQTLTDFQAEFVQKCQQVQTNS